MTDQTAGRPGSVPEALYYQPPARTSPIRLVATGLVGTVGGIAAAWVYAYLDLRSPLFYLNVLLVLGFGWAVGVCTAAGAWLSKVRDRRAVMRLAATVGALSYYFAWVFWLGALFPTHLYGTGNPSLRFMDPAMLWDGVTMVFRRGAWSIASHGPLGGESRINGPVLAAVWLGEAATFFAIAIWTAAARAPRRALCEGCHSWCSRPHLIYQLSGGVNGMELRSYLEAKDWQCLSTLPTPKWGEASIFNLECERCDQCGQTRLLSLTRLFAAARRSYVYANQSSASWWGEYIAAIVTGERRRSHDAMVVMDKLRITVEDLAAIEASPPWDAKARRMDEPVPDDAGSTNADAEEADADRGE